MAAQADPAWCSDERYARIALSFLAEPGDPVLGALMRAVSAAEVMRVVLTGADLGLIDLELALVRDLAGQRAPHGGRRPRRQAHALADRPAALA